MTEYSLASVERPEGAVAAVVVAEQVHVLPGEPSMRELLADWDAWLERIESDLAADRLEPATPLGEVRLAAPVPEPRNLYMAGANYADHAREMRKLSADTPIEPSPHGPFFFLRPTTSVVGPEAAVVNPPGVEKLDWEVELAAVVGHPARGLSEAEALDCLAGYTVINDVSVRDLFKREPATEPPMTFDWFMQKGWATTCPMGPTLVPAKFCPEPGSLEMTLTVNDLLEQRSSTAQMIHSLPEQIAFLSRAVELRPGDVISTGTPAGVGMGKGRFLKVGDVMVAEIEGLGRLRNTVTGD